MRLAEVQRRVRDIWRFDEQMCGWQSNHARVTLYRDTLRALLNHDIDDDARQLIEAALEAER